MIDTELGAHCRERGLYPEQVAHCRHAAQDADTKPLQLRTEHLASLRTPTLILQVERDSFRRREEVETYSLSPQAHLRWKPSGDHSFKPTRSSGLSEAENWATAVALGDQFLRELISC